MVNSIKKIVFKNSHYNWELNNLPNSIEQLELPKEYKFSIEKIPNNLKKIICSDNYKFKNDYVGIRIEYY